MRQKARLSRIVWLLRNKYQFFSIYKAKENSDHPGYFYAVTQGNFLLIKDNKTHLRIDKKIITFPGNAFDCTSELVLLAMENS